MYERPISENCWQLQEGLYRILLPLPLEVPFVNAYLIQSGNEWALIDAGYNWGPSLRALGRALKAVGVPARGLTHLILTHRHKDHAGGAAAVAGRWGGTVHLHPADQALHAPTAAENVQWLAEAGVPEAEREELLAAWRTPLEALPPRVAPLLPEQELRVGELRFRVIHTPGHSPGHVLLHEPERNWLFLGDHVLEPKAPNTWYTPGTSGDPLGDYLQNLEQVRDLPEALLLPGHGLPWQGSAWPAAKAMMDFQRQLLLYMEATLAHQPQTAWDVASRAAPEAVAEPHLAWWATAAVVSQLRHLEAQGRARLVWQGGRPLWQVVPPARIPAGTASN